MRIKQEQQGKQMVERPVIFTGNIPDSN